MIDTGKAFCVANKQFMNGIRDLAQYSSNDAVVEVSILKLVKMTNAMTLINYASIFFMKSFNGP